MERLSYIWLDVKKIILTFFFVCSSLMLHAGIKYAFTLADEPIKLDTICSPSGVQYIRFIGEGLCSSGEIGQPNIPYKVIRFLVPENAYNFTAQISSKGGMTTYIVDIPLCTIQKSISINDYYDGMSTSKDEVSYGDFIAEIKASIKEENWLEGQYHIVSVAIYPIGYNSQNNKIQIYNELEVSLEWQEKIMPYKKLQGIIDNSLINIDDVVVNKRVLEGAEKTVSKKIVEEENPFKYYIISEQSLLPALDDLAVWKKQKGYDVKLTAIEDIYNNQNYKVGEETGIVDEAESLRRYLQDEFYENGTFFCLLVGDHRTKMPIRKFKYTDRWHTDKEGINGDAYLPTDNYFSDLSEDSWNLFKDNYGLYVDSIRSIKYCPSIYVGRLLCNDAKQISNYTSKLILYETNPGRGNSEYLNNSNIFVQYDGGTDTFGVAYSKVFNQMDSIFENVECFLDSKISDENAASYPTGEIALSNINNVGYNSLVGHGEPSSIACSGRRRKGYEWEYIKALESYSYEDGQTQIDHECNNCGIDKMTNFDSPSVLYSMACTTTPFDTYNDGFLFDLPHTMASSYTVGGLYGGVAYLGNTREGYWVSSPDLEVLFLKNLISFKKVGVAEAMSKYLFNYIPRSRADIYPRFGHNLVGDPEFEIWRSKPQNLDVTLQISNEYPNHFGISGGTLDNYRIVLYDGESKFQVLDYQPNASHMIPYLNKMDQMEAIGIYKSGFLPLVTLDCKNQTLTNCNKKFVVRDARIVVSQQNDGNKVAIGEGAQVSIRSVDNTLCGNNLEISDGGRLNIKSDKMATIEGGIVLSDGQIIVNAEKVEVSKGFSVKLGGSLIINKK